MDENMDSLSADDFIRKLCEDKTVYRLRGDNFGEYRFMKMLYCQKVRDHLFSEYSEQLEEILNENYGEMASNEVADTDRLIRLCETQIIVIMKGDEPGSYSSFNRLFTPEAKKELVEIHGDNIIEFVNERFLEKKE
jgi:hypothetical protein